MEEQSKCEGFLQLDIDTVIHVLQQNDLSVSQESTVLDAVEAWLTAHPRIRYSIICQICFVIYFKRR